MCVIGPISKEDHKSVNLRLLWVLLVKCYQVIERQSKKDNQCAPQARLSDNTAPFIVFEKSAQASWSWIRSDGSTCPNQGRAWFYACWLSHRSLYSDFNS